MMHALAATCRRKLQILGCAIGIAALLMADAPVSGATVPRVAGSAAQPPSLGFRQILDRPLLWPELVVIKEGISDGQNDAEPGTALAVVLLVRDGVVVAFPGSGDPTLIPYDWTDVLERAGTASAALPEDVRDLTFAQLVTRADLLPPTVRLVEDVEFPDRVREAGREIGPYRVIRSGSDYVLAAVDPEFVRNGALHDRQSYAIASTDFVKQLRAQFAPDASARESRLRADLRGRLVSAGGEPLPDPEQAPRYYAVYASAAWCGWCARFNPTLIKFYEEVKPNHPDFEVVYYSRDHSEEAMLAYMQKSGMEWPAVRFDERLNTPFLHSIISGGTPQVVILAADGRIVHDGLPAGVEGAKAALNALRRELAKPNP